MKSLSNAQLVTISIALLVVVGLSVFVFNVYDSPTNWGVMAAGAVLVLGIGWLVTSRRR